MKKKRHHILKNILIMAAVFLVASGRHALFCEKQVCMNILPLFLFLQCF